MTNNWTSTYWNSRVGEEDWSGIGSSTSYEGFVWATRTPLLFLVWARLELKQPILLHLTCECWSVKFACFCNNTKNDTRQFNMLIVFGHPFCIVYYAEHRQWCAVLVVYPQQKCGWLPSCFETFKTTPLPLLPNPLRLSQLPLERCPWEKSVDHMSCGANKVWWL